jgi:putative tryptophan/tyrosine transport system substrate-binding protein
MRPALPDIGALAGRVLAAAALLAMAGCAGWRPAPVDEIPPPPADSVHIEPHAPPVAPAEVPGRPPEPAVHDVAVLFAGDVGGHVEVADRVAELLPAAAFRVSRIDIRAPDSAAAVDDLLDRPKLVTVAVGLGAVELARARLGERPMVFCQVFNYQDLLHANGSTWGVQSVPPLALQMQAWRKVDASLGRIGLIVGEAQAQWLDEAREAASRAGVELRAEVSASDRETLYLFKRLAPQIDGFWLLPDNSILSPAVLRELLSYALSHDVGVLVFNEALLGWGALMSASGTPTDVARTVGDLVTRVAAERTEGLPAMTALSEVALVVNPDIARRLGVEVGPAASWVLRDLD